MPNRIGEAERAQITPAYKATLPRQHCISPTNFLARYAYGNSFYAYTQGLLKVVVLNPYTYGSPQSLQYKWLRDELENQVDRSVTPWVMAVVHTPFYTTFGSHTRNSNLDGMEHLFNQYNVNVVVGGHDHGYMRSRNMAENGVFDESKRAPVYLIVGTGGSDEGPPKDGYKQFQEAEPWVAARNYRVTGFGQLTVHNATHAEWEYHANHEVAEAWYFRHMTFNDSSSSSAEDDATYTDRAWLVRHV